MLDKISNGRLQKVGVEAVDCGFGEGCAAVVILRFAPMLVIVATKWSYNRNPFSEVRVVSHNGLFETGTIDNMCLTPTCGIDDSNGSYCRFWHELLSSRRFV